MSSDDQRKGFTVTDRRHVDGSIDATPNAAAQEAPPPGGASSPQGAAAVDGAGPLPIDLATFVMSLASSALMHLGELEHPEARPNLALAKQTIDILGMLSDKTRGNLTSDEEKLLKHILYDLRLKYVEAKKTGR